MKTQTYGVLFKGRFPLDMLRYDRAYPADQTSAAIMELDNKETKMVKVSSPIEPTIDRWLSFGCEVIYKGVHFYP